MAGGNLKIQVLLSAVNRLTGPLRSAAGQARILSGAIRENRQRIDALNRTQARINGFREAVQQVRASGRTLSQAQAKVRELAAQMNAAGGGTARMRQQMERANNAVTRASAQLDRHRASALQMRNALRDAGVDTQRLGQHEQRLRSDLAGANAELERQRQRLERLNRIQERVNAAQARYQGLMNARNNLASAGMGMTLAGGGVLMAGMKGVDASGDFQHQMAAYGLVAGESGPQLEALKQRLMELSPAVNGSVGELLQMQAVLVGKGMSSKIASESLEMIGKAATATGASFGDMGNLAYSMIDNMGLKTSELQTALEIAAKAGDLGGFELKDMATSFPQLTSAAKQLGLEGTKGIATMAAALQVAMKGAADPATAANNFANFMQKATAPDTVKRFKKFGINIQAELDKGLKAGKDPIDIMMAQINKATGGKMEAEIAKAVEGGENAMTAAQRVSAKFKLGELFGDKQVLDFLAPMLANMGQFRTIRDQALNSHGVIDEKFATMMGTYNEVKKGLFIDFGNASESAFSTLLPVLTELMNKLRAGVQWVGKFARENPELVATILKIVGAAAAFIAVLGGLALVMAAIIGPFAMFQFAATMMAIKLPFLGAAIGKIVMVFRLLSMALLTSPFGLIVLLATAGILLWKNWDWVWGKILGIVDRVKTAWAGGLGGMMQLLADWNPVNLFLSACQAIADAVMGFFGINSPSTLFASFGTYLMQGLANGVTAGLGFVQDAITGAAGSAIGWFKEKLGINSPSVVFAGLGGFTMQGLAQGLSQNAALPLAAVNDVAKQLASTKVVAGFGMALAGAAPALAGGLPPLAAMPAFDARPPLLARASDGGAAGPTTISITINAAPGMDERALAQMVAEKIEETKRREERQARGRLSDFD